MNILDVQDKLKNLSEQQLVQEMQMPSGSAPQFLVLSEITRRKRMRDEMMSRQQAPQRTVAEEAVAAAGMPQAGLGQMARSMAPQSDVVQNTGIAQTMPPELPVQGMAEGGYVRKMAEGGDIVVRNGRQYRVLPNGQLLDVFTGQVVSDPSSAPMVGRWEMGGTGPTVAGKTSQELYRDYLVSGAEARPDSFLAGSGIGPFDGYINPSYYAGGANPSYSEDRPDRWSGDYVPPVPGSEYLVEPGDYPTAVDVTGVTDAPMLRVGPTPSAYSPMSLPLPGQMGVVDRMRNGELPQPRGWFVGDGTRTPSPMETFAEDFGVPVDLDLTRSRDDLEAIKDAGLYAPEATAYDKIMAEAAATAPGLSPEQIDELGPAEVQPGVVAGAGRSGFATVPLGLPDPTPTALQLADAAAEAEYYANKGPAFEQKGRDSGPEEQGWLSYLWDRYTGPGMVAVMSPEDVAKKTAAESVKRATDAINSPDAPVDSTDARSSATETSGGSGGAYSGSGTSGSGGSGAAVSGMSSYEQELVDAIKRSEKRAEQDKWLALAQAGMALMASSQPTLGGALGEAGAKGLAAFQQGRDAAEADRMKLLEAQFGVQMARQRAAAGGGGGSRPPSRKDILSEVETLQELASSPGISESDRLWYNKQAQALIEALYGTPTSSGPDFVATAP